MNTKWTVLSFVMLLFFIHPSSAQKSVVNVNTLTGTANVIIPVYGLTQGNVSFPINLVYSATGVKPKDVESTAGMGWQLQCGGQISRQVKGLPDDSKNDISLNTRTGWMYGSSTAISGFGISNTGDFNCTNEANDISYINGHFSYTVDTEPDMFYVNAPGLSCQLVYDNVNQKFRTIPYQDLVITYTTNSNAGSPLFGVITSFTITNDQGISYVFSVPEFVQEQTVTSGSSGTYFQNTYKQYQYGIQYYDSWYLKSMTDANGNGVVLNYTTAPMRVSADPVILYGGAANSATVTYNQYTIQLNVTPEVLSSVQVADGDYISNRLNFNWITNPTGQTNYGTGQSMIQSITGSGKNLDFQYSSVSYTRSDNSVYNRYFLRSFSDPGCSSPINYQFSYLNEIPPAPGSYYTTTLADSTSTHIDYWGYFNANPSASLVPSLYVNPSNAAYQRYAIWASASAGTDYAYMLPSTFRYADTTNVKAGSLQTITYAQGGSTTLSYQSNDYLDVPSNTTVYGGGIRIRAITDNDNVTGAHVTRSYAYANPSTGLSSGKPISLPVYGFTTAYTGTATGTDYWNYSTMRSANDLSQDDHSIMYEYVRETMTGAGSTLYQYYIPATNWDATAAPGCNGCTADWNPMTNYVARPVCSSYGSVKNDIDSYPFAPSLNYGFERGLMQKVITYNEASAPQKVSETDYTYQRTGTPGVINAFKFDLNANNSGQSLTGYSKYNMYYGTGELTASAISTVYDSQNYNQPHSSTVTYTYGNAQHKLTQLQTTNSDGSIITKNTTYVKDFTSAGAGTNGNVNAIYNLQLLNINAPVESWQQVTIGGVSKVTGASLTLFNAFNAGPTVYQPSQQLKLIQPDGIPVTGTGAFMPYTATGSGGGQVSGYDSRYNPIANYTVYDFSGYLLTADDNAHHMATWLIDHLTYKPTAIFKNAAFSEVGFNDFDSTILYAFAITGSGSFTPNGSHTGNAYGLGTSQTISKTITKNLTAQNYIFSIWVNAPVSNNTINVSLNGGAAVPLTYTGTGSWQYLERKIPVTSMPASFSVAITSAQAISIDDVLFYPEVAEVTTYSYDPVTRFTNAQTNTNGVSAYYTNDQWGRSLFTYDQNKNIIQKNTYVTPQIEKTFTTETLSIGYNGPLYSNTAAAFFVNGIDPCAAAGVTVNWNFGDGGSASTALSTSPTHSYAATGTYTVTATINSPLFGSKTISTTVTVVTRPPGNITLSYNNNTTGPDIYTISFTNSSGTTTFTGPQLNGSIIPQGTYTISVYVKNGTLYNSGTGIGYSSVYLHGDCNWNCGSFVSGNTYTFSNMNLSSCTTFNATLSTLTCSQLGGGLP